MDTLLYKYKEKIKGVLEGFDRIVFRGMLKPLCYAAGMQTFLSRHGVLNKDYKEWINHKSASIIKDAEVYAREQTATSTQYLASCNIRKYCSRTTKKDRYSKWFNRDFLMCGIV